VKPIVFPNHPRLRMADCGGGAFDTPLIENVTTEWSAVPARYRELNIGFRCAKDAR